MKFTQAGHVEVILDGPTGGPLRLEVRDTGCGMSEAQAARAFEPFAQADSSVTRRHGGAGLGLSIVRRFVEMMQGDVEIDSRLGVGTCVRITLPLAEAQEAQAGAAAPAEPLSADGVRDQRAVDEAEEGPPLTGLRVLAADDNAINRATLAAVLTMAGAEATVVDSGEAALHAFAPDRFDVILLDIMMPGMDGLETLDALRAKEAGLGGGRTPVVAATANVLRHQIESYLAHGFDAHLGKPVTGEDLVDALAPFRPKERAR